VRLDLAQNPETYLSIQPQLDSQGRVWLTVGNRTTMPVSNVTLIVGVVDQSGRTVYGPERVGTGGNVIRTQGGERAHLARPVRQRRGAALREVEGRERAAGAVSRVGFGGCVWLQASVQCSRRPARNAGLCEP